MNTLATALIALATFGTASAAVLAPTCQDLAGQGFACVDAVVDPAGGNVDVDAVVVIEPTPPGLLALDAALAPTCQDLAGQGFACVDAVVDPAGGNVDVDAVVVIQPQPPQ